jgi:hypothetical protein
VSVALFDLGQRLRAAVLCRPVARSAFAPVLPPENAVAVTIRGSGDHVLLRAADETHRAADETVASGPGALSALGRLGVSIDAEPRTLVVPDRDTLARLYELATATDSTPDNDRVAAVVGWWALRADHPGTGAVLNVTAACSARWVLGAPPEDERDLASWRAWLGVNDRGPRGLLQLAAAVAAGTTLPGLEAFAEDDRDSWESFVLRLLDPKAAWDWRRRDSRREAALGLATRCDAAELWESLRLGDPLVACRESFAGTVITGAVVGLPARGTVEIAVDQLTCRLRENTAVEGFAGYPVDLPPATLTGSSAALVRGRVSSSRVTSGDRLLVTVGDGVIRAGALRLGQRLTLRPRSIDPRQQRSGRQELRRRYVLRRSWLSGGAPPVPRRRDVPLDVVIAAAE